MKKKLESTSIQAIIDLQIISSCFYWFHSYTLPTDTQSN